MAVLGNLGTMFVRDKNGQMVPVPVIRGEDGGFYTPEIKDGVIRWVASRPDMPEVPDMDIGTGGGGGTPDAVQFVPQKLTDNQQAQARENIGAARTYTLKDGETIDDAPEDADIVWDPENEGEGAGTGGGTVDLTEVHERIDALENEIENLGGTLTEPAEDDIPKVFFGGALQQTKDEAVVPFSYRSKTLSFDCYAEIKAQGNSTMSWPKKNQTVKLYADADCTKKLKIDFKGWGKQNKFVIKANWRDLTHVRDIVSVRLEGDCLRSNPDYDTFPELLKTSPNMGGIDGFPVVVYAAGVYQGRYMWNIPKDKWMTNMDDELDEHCILCSEDYNSSCFRKAANINGSDWTDEIHDVVPASIKKRWNEVISFVMNSSDEEFKANLDSYIKVSTLIDRHLMGLLSCDFDGYGKNQLYITYDGQQWYADRYDKDGTWGNYWTGNSMLPSNYRREQYEDMISNRPGNLLFIRLEKLFWERLQSRWAELRVNELSIPNIINRFRELYDITPPYLIEEDYASTTANGAFTGIPNKTTCTIQQIQKFVVERYAWTDAYVAGLTGGGTEPDEPEITLVSISATYSGGDVDVGTELSALTGIVVVGTYSDGSTSAITGYTLSGEIMEGVNTITVAYQGKTATFTVTGVADEEEPANTTVLAENFSANGEKFEYTVNDIDFAAGDYIEVSMDVSNCVNTNENVLSIGEGIDTYNAGKKLHFYYTANDKWLRCVNRTVGANQQFGCCSTTGTVKITVKNDGMYVDDVLKESFAQYDATVNSLTSLSIGSTEGTTRSNAYYHYIVVVKTQPTQIPCTGITLDKTMLSFTNTGSQTIVATVTPADTTDKVVWSSDNNAVANVANGVVTPVADGSANITAVCGNYSANCAVTVSGVAEAPMYSLSETAFDGTNIVDTGVQLFNEDKDFTVIIEAQATNSGAKFIDVNGMFFSTEGTAYRTGFGNKPEYHSNALGKKAVAIFIKESNKYAWYFVNEDKTAYMNTTASFTQTDETLKIGKNTIGTIYSCCVYARALSVSDAISMSGIDIVNADIVWSETPSYSINSGDVVSGKTNYITPDAIAVPDGYTSAVLENINGSTFTWQGVAQYDADMAFIKYTEGSASTRCLVIGLDANTKFVRFSVYPNDNSYPENGIAAAFFGYQ